MMGREEGARYERENGATGLRNQEISPPPPRREAHEFASFPWISRVGLRNAIGGAYLGLMQIGSLNNKRVGWGDLIRFMSFERGHKLSMQVEQRIGDGEEGGQALTRSAAMRRYRL